MNFFIMFFLFVSSCLASDDQYKSFLDYNSDNINLIRAITFDSRRISYLREWDIDENHKAFVHRENNRLIVAFNGKDNCKDNYNLNNMDSFAEEIGLSNYESEVVISGDFSCSNLSLLFAERHLNFSIPHQHKVVLFGTPTLSETSIYKRIIEKLKYKNDIVIFDYYSFIPKDISIHPGLPIEITPRNYISDIINDPFLSFCSLFKISAFSFGNYCLLNLIKNFICTEMFANNNETIINSTIGNHVFCNFNDGSLFYFLGLVASAVLYHISSQEVDKHLVPSEESVQEAFLRFKETFCDAYLPLEKSGTLSFFQALRL